MIKINTIKLIKGDCLEKMKEIQDKSISMILCDLPYGVTNRNKWDTVISLNDYIEIDNKTLTKGEFYYSNLLKGISKKELDVLWTSLSKEGLWTHYNRIIKDNGAIVLTAQQPFTNTLIQSNTKCFKYEWIWKKLSGKTGHLNANKMPLREHESILVFYKKQPTYNPQMIGNEERTVKHGKNKKEQLNYGEFEQNKRTQYKGYYPSSILEFQIVSSMKRLHETEKPVPLLEYLIKTYTNDIGCEIILDNCMGSCSCGEAVLKVGGDRNFIGIEKDDTYFEICKNRVNTYIEENNLQYIHIEIAE